LPIGWGRSRISLSYIRATSSTAARQDSAHFDSAHPLFTGGEPVNFQIALQSGTAAHTRVLPAALAWLQIMESPFMPTYRVDRLMAAWALAASVALVWPSGAPAAGIGQSCGGRLGIACSRGLFCDLPAGTCGGRDTDGTCVRIPRFCVQRIGRPVCGCDGKTYINNCLRERTIVSKRHDGRC